MNKQIVKALLGGILLGTAVFFAPFFLLKIVIVCMIISAIVRMMFWRHMSRWGGMHPMMAMAEKVRGMSEEDYQTFKQKMSQHQMHYCTVHSCGHSVNNMNK